MTLTDRAWALQHRIENRIATLPSLSITTYLQFIAMVCFITGMGMFVYCILCDVNILVVSVYTNPLFYLALGFTTFMFFLLEKFIPTKH